MQTTFSYTQTVHLKHPEVHGFHQNLPTCCIQESIIVWDPRLSKHDQDNSHFVPNRPEDDLFNVSFTIKPIRDSIRRCCKGYFCDFGAGNLPRSEVQVGQHQFLRGVVALPFNGWWERAGSVGKPKSRQWRWWHCGQRHRRWWPEGDSWKMDEHRLLWI